MTNGEKYLKVSVNKFFSAIIESKTDISGLYSLEKWLLDGAKPTLTEDERVILRNIKGDCKYIGRKYDNERKYNEGILYICARTSSSVEYKYLGCYNHLFQFIKERRRILY